ncbi:flagellar motor switch phosphatase FliY [Anaerotignum sp. MB30-C6]|uniref:flagellar motor switch phosphatase FliY n=1 Tax=Anaerotignum sp. MB30-C6 TaxID=3070814 RepID=UPI0027DE33ED|nr:flagellar motor switch phosphatase FliY [Anaerotignum sp. MB30-C6]WMI80976.1 flagellar motor switch phosphatase FliY [Anaerotignum sp. MB30-C6]
MEEKVFNSLEMDAIGEILNISLGASATAVSTMLDRRVDITVPNVMISSKESFEFSYMEPAVGVEITYVSGLSGNNIMLLKRHDVKIIVEILMGMEIPDDEFELNEINLSAICEVMNQMMGASSTALAELLGEPVNISTPNSFEINTVAEFSEKYLLENEPMVVVRFSLKVEEALESEFLNIMTVDLARKMLSCFGLGGETEADKAEEATPVVEPQAMEFERFMDPPQSEDSNRMMSQEEIEKLLSQSFQSDADADVQPEPVKVEVKPVQPAPPPVEIPPVAANVVIPQPSFAPQAPAVSAQPKVINVTPNAELQNQGEGVSQERAENLGLILGVPLEISVEIGRTKKNVREILEYNKGSLIVLDKLAGEQVDIYVNGQCIAKGDVVVVDDNFGVRVTEVLRKI